MKIGINARTFSIKEPGGAVQVAIRHTKSLINDPDIDVVLFGPDDLNKEFPNTNVVSSGYSGNSQFYGLFWERVILPRIASKQNVDLLYCPNGNAPLIPTSYSVVVCIHDVNSFEGWSSSIHQLYRRAMIPLGARLADSVITVSEFSKQEIATHLDISLESIHVVHNGIDEIFFSDSSGDQFRLPSQYILFVGALNPRKNIKNIIRSFIILKDKSDFDTDLVIIGPRNKKIFKNMSIEERNDIHTPGFVTKKQLKHAYINADVFLYPSLYEGFGLPPLEAMACGTPVIASNRTSMPEILNDAALLIDPTNVDEIVNSVKKILENGNKADELRVAGKTRAKKFTWTKATKTLTQKLRDIHE